MNKTQIATIIHSILILLILYFVYELNSQKTPTPKIAYIDNVKLFNEFNMSKDMSTVYKNKIHKQTLLVDSLYNQFQQSIQTKQKSEVIKKYQYNFNKSKESLDKLQKYFTQNVSKQVWDRLTKYIAVFAKKSNYNLILGAQGNGSIMYGDSLVNVTQQALEFCNKKYEGEDVK